MTDETNAEIQRAMDERAKNQEILENFDYWLETVGEDERFTSQDALIGSGYYDKDRNYSYNQRRCIYNKIYYNIIPWDYDDILSDNPHEVGRDSTNYDLYVQNYSEKLDFIIQRRAEILAKLN